MRRKNNHKWLRGELRPKQQTKGCLPSRHQLNPIANKTRQKQKTVSDPDSLPRRKQETEAAHDPASTTEHPGVVQQNKSSQSDTSTGRVSLRGAGLKPGAWSFQPISRPITGNPASTSSTNCPLARHRLATPTCTHTDTHRWTLAWVHDNDLISTDES